MKWCLLMAVAGSIFLSASTSASAQSSAYDSAHFSRPIEAHIGVRFPIGGDYRQPNTKPKFSLGLRSETESIYIRNWALNSHPAPSPRRELKLSLTMEAKPSIFLNDRRLNFGDDTHGPDGPLNALDTYDKTVLTLIGVSLAVIAGSIIAISE